MQHPIFQNAKSIKTSFNKKGRPIMTMLQTEFIVMITKQRRLIMNAMTALLKIH